MHARTVIALINLCLTGKISKGISKHLPFSLLTSLSGKGGEPGGSGNVVASAAGDANAGAIGSNRISLCTGTCCRTSSHLVSVCQHCGRDPCILVQQEKEASAHPQKKQMIQEAQNLPWHESRKSDHCSLPLMCMWVMICMWAQ